MKFGTRSALTPAGWESMVALLDPLRLYDLSPGALCPGSSWPMPRDWLCSVSGWNSAGTICSLPPAVWNGWPGGRNCWICRWPVPMRPAAREMAAVKLSIGEGDFTPEGIRRSLLAAGLEAELEEDFSQRLIRVTDARIIGGYQTLDEVKAQVRRMLPAHLEVEFDIGVLTWEMFEAIGLDFAAWDSRDFTWEWFDLNGEKLGGE